MKKVTIVLCIMILFSVLLTNVAFAAEPGGAPDVRVNGSIVEFPDAGPFIDENSRTMIPVRFVAENLGAKVSWDQDTQTATIEKGYITVKITIGDAELFVINEGIPEKVTMDTAAVLRDSRTYVPIRFVAEALGAYVDYSDEYRTVGIYSDVLTPEQIKMLQALPYTQFKGAFGYEDGKQKWSQEDVELFYGTGRDSFGTFANAREHLYHIESVDNPDTFYKEMVKCAVKDLECNTPNVTVRFLADTSCIYQSDSMDGLTCAVRGIAEVTLRVHPQQLEHQETLFLCRLGFTQLNEGVMYIPVDAHICTLEDGLGNLDTLSPIGEAF